jgi:hypothetical protein
VQQKEKKEQKTKKKKKKTCHVSERKAENHQKSQTHYFPKPI